MIEEDEWPDHAPLRKGQHAADAEASEVTFPRLNDEFDHLPALVLCSSFAYPATAAEIEAASLPRISYGRCKIAVAFRRKKRNKLRKLFRLTGSAGRMARPT
jgi:hypothetical protein